MSDNGGGKQPSKKETVYSGPIPASFNAYPPAPAMAAMATETVYKGTVASETVFDENKFVPKQPNRAVAIAATKDRVQRMSILFFVVAGYSLFEYFTYRGNDSAVAINSLGVFVIFLIIGIFAMRLSRAAFLVAMALYAIDTALLLWWVFGAGGTLLFVAWPLLVHSIILYRLYLTYGMLADLHAR
jgi:hypothetical protein